MWTGYFTKCLKDCENSPFFYFYVERNRAYLVIKGEH